MTSEPTKIVIVGAGPSGLLLAHNLLQSTTKTYDITLLEQRPDFRTYTAEQSRTFPIALQRRGWDALPEDVQSTLSAQGVWTDGICLHSASGKTRVIPREKSNLSIDRNRVTLTLLEALVQSNEINSHPHKLAIHFDSAVESMDFDKQTLRVTKSNTQSTISYDYLVAADGGNFKIRTALVDQGHLQCDKKEIPQNYRTLQLLREAPPVVSKPAPNPSIINRLWTNVFPTRGPPSLSLDPNKIHGWMFANNVKCIGCPIHPGLVSCAYIFDKGQDPFVGLKTPAEVQEYFKNISPTGLGRLVTHKEAKALLQRPSSTGWSVRCSKLHHSNVLLLGDAAHSVSASAGQGANSALQDVQVFCRILQETDHDWDKALPKYTDVRLSNAHAVSDISDYCTPCNKWLQFEFILRLIGRKLLPKWMLRPMPMELLNDTTQSYTEVLKGCQWWIDKVRRAMEQKQA